MNLNSGMNESNPEKPHPLAKWVGIWKDHRDFEDFRRNIEEYRRQRDEEEEKRLAELDAVLDDSSAPSE
jgi:hypothetical protein